MKTAMVNQSRIDRISIKAKKEDGSNIIVLGPGGELTASRFVPRKSGKGSSTIIIVGPGGMGQPNNHHQNYAANNNHNNNNVQGSNVQPGSNPTWSMPNPNQNHPPHSHSNQNHPPNAHSLSSPSASSSNIQQHLVPIGSSPFHNALSDNQRDRQQQLLEDWSSELNLSKDQDIRDCPQGSVNCGRTSILPQLIPIMVPYVKPKTRLSVGKSSNNQNNRAQESRVNFQKTSLLPTTPNPTEPQIIIRKTKNSPPILIEEVKGSEDGYVDFHVTSQPNSQTPQITQYPSVNSNANSQQMSNHHGIGMMYPTTVMSQQQRHTGDDENNRSVKTQTGGLNGLNGYTTMTSMSPMSSVNTMNALNSLNIKTNQVNQLGQSNGMKQMINTPTFVNPGYTSMSGITHNQGTTVTEQTMLPYSYNSPTLTLTSPTTITDTNDYGSKGVKDNSENQEIYDEKVFNQFYGFDQVPTIDLGNLPGEEHLPGLLLNNQDNVESGGRRRIDPSDSFLDHDNNSHLSSHGPKRSGLNSIIQSSHLNKGPINEEIPTWNEDFIPKWIENGKPNTWSQDDRSNNNDPFNWWWPWMQN
uniref:Uncharacterized protein n=1 Tax=Tetranychus urticae TaxID=32264 RepID=T1KY64_TETUR